MTDRQFTAAALAAVLGVIALGAWLDRDLIDPHGEQIAAEQLPDAQAWERQRQAQDSDSAARVRDAYASGLRDGARGTYALLQGHHDLDAAQACAALTHPAR